MAKIKTPQSLNEIDTAKSFEALPKGNYSVRILNYKDGVSQAGNAKVDLEMEVTSGSFLGRKLFGNITPGSVAALPFVRAALEAFGCPWDDEGFDPAGLLGKTATAVVDIDPTNSSRNQVKTFKKTA
jgi:hypothetical protein